MIKQKITLFRTTEMGLGVVKDEGYLIAHGKSQYAQYNDCPFVEFVPKGKRNPVRIRKGYQPFILIAEGWDLQGMPSAFTKEEGQGCTISRSRHSAFSDEWITEFNNWINPFIAMGRIKVIADYRYNKEDVSLLQAVKNNDKAQIKELENQAEKGEIIRII